RRTPLPLGSCPLALTAAVLGFGLAAAQVLPSLELSRRSHRAATPTEGGYALYAGEAMPLHYLVALFTPDFFGHPLRGDFHGVTLVKGGAELSNYAEMAAYVGVVGLALALLGALQGSRVNRRAGYLALLATLALAMAMG